MSLNFKIMGNRIKELRLRNGFSQEKLAEMCNLSISHISRVESAIKRPSLDCLVNLGNILGVTVNTFLYGNQKNDLIGYKSELFEIIEDCDNYEKQVIFNTAKSIKKIIRENNSLAPCAKFWPLGYVLLILYFI